MSIFRRDTETPSEPTPAPRPTRSTPKAPPQKRSAPSDSTQIANGSKVVGQISGTADLVIDGVVEGEIELESRVVVGGEGRVEGKILARSVEVGGKVQGNVQGLERVEVLASGSLEGDVLSPRVVIAEGAFFKGKVEMTDKVQRPQASAKSPGKSAEQRSGNGSAGNPQGTKGPGGPPPASNQGKNAGRLSP